MADGNRHLRIRKRVAAFYLIPIVIIVIIAVSGAAAPSDKTSLSAAEDVQVVVIDPGHGGHDHGVTGQGGISEKQLMLALAGKISRRLEPTFKVHLTRTGDYNLDIRHRTSIANNHDADLFISLHTGGSYGSGVSGWSVYHDQPKTVSRHILEKIKGPFLWDQVQQRHIRSSSMLAEKIGKRLEAGAAGQIVDIMGAPLAVLSGADMPAVVIEAGCLTHASTAQKFAQEAFIDEVAADIARGIFDFFEK